MECLHCRGRMVAGTAPFTVERHGYHLTWDALPAWVCQQCGEPYFESPTVTAIQNALAAVDRENEQLRTRTPAA